MGIFLFFSLKGSSLPGSPEKRNYLASAHDSENSLKLSFYLSNRCPNEWEKGSGVSMWMKGRDESDRRGMERSLKGEAPEDKSHWLNTSQTNP